MLKLQKKEIMEHIQILEVIGGLLSSPILIKNQPIPDFDPYWTLRIQMARRFKKTFTV